MFGTQTQPFDLFSNFRAIASSGGIRRADKPGLQLIAPVCFSGVSDVLTRFGIACFLGVDQSGIRDTLMFDYQGPRNIRHVVVFSNWGKVYEKDVDRALFLLIKNMDPQERHILAQYYGCDNINPTVYTNMIDYGDTFIAKEDDRIAFRFVATVLGPKRAREAAKDIVQSGIKANWADAKMVHRNFKAGMTAMFDNAAAALMSGFGI